MRTTFLSLALAALLLAAPAVADAAAGAGTHKAAAKAPQGQTVYAGQADFTEEELLRFIRHLPQFRSWLATSGEKAQPGMTRGQPDFVYSPGAAQWAQFRGWDPRRFFCVMGRSAAAMVIVSEGEQVKARYKDMPRVSSKECQLVQKHLGELLKAGNEAAQAK